jgi:hypothetical protein
MFKSNSSLTIRVGSFFSWKSDDSIVASATCESCTAFACRGSNGSNAPGAKGVTEVGPQTLNFTEDPEP